MAANPAMTIAPTMKLPMITDLLEGGYLSFVRAFWTRKYRIVPGDSTSLESYMLAFRKRSLPRSKKTSPMMMNVPPMGFPR